MTRMGRVVGIGLMLAGLLATPAVARAQQPPRAAAGARAGGAARVGGNGALTPVELERWFDSYVLVQAQQALQLSDEQFGRTLPALRAVQAARRRHLQERRQLLNAIAGLLKATPPDEAALRDRLRALRELDARSAEDLQKAYDALDEVLDPARQARFRVFEGQVERRKIDLLMRARQRANELSRR